MRLWRIPAVPEQVPPEGNSEANPTFSADHITPVSIWLTGVFFYGIANLACQSE
jgi:hypothetical protein